MNCESIICLFPKQVRDDNVVVIFIEVSPIKEESVSHRYALLIDFILWGFFGLMIIFRRINIYTKAQPASILLFNQLMAVPLFG